MPNGLSSRGIGFASAEDVVEPPVPTLKSLGPRRTHRGRKRKVVAVAAIALVAQCHLDQLFNGASSGQIVVTPATVVASAGVGTRVAETIAVSSSAAGLVWTARALQPATWLAIAETSGTAPAMLHLSLVTAGLAVGTYLDTISLTGDGAPLAPTMLPVELDVVPASGAQLAVTTEPSASIAGAPIAPPIVVTMEDSLGNPVTTFTGNVTAALAANPGGATLEGIDVDHRLGGDGHVLQSADYTLGRGLYRAFCERRVERDERGLRDQPGGSYGARLHHGANDNSRGRSHLPGRPGRRRGLPWELRDEL